MNSIAHKYMNLSARPLQEDVGSEPIAAEEELKLQSFEDGYQAGWADATQALHSEQQRIFTEFAQNVQDMSFTYHEALTKIMGTFQPVLLEIVSRILPDTARASLAGHITQEVEKLVNMQVGGDVTIMMSPSTLSAARKFLTVSDSCASFKLDADAGLSDGQVHLKVGATERELDLDAVTEGIVEAIHAFFNQANPEQAND